MAIRTSTSKSKTQMATSDLRVELNELRGLLTAANHWIREEEFLPKTPERSGTLSRLYRHCRTLRKLIRWKAFTLGVPVPPEARQP